MNINVNHIIILLYVYIIVYMLTRLILILIIYNTIQNRFLLPPNSKNSFRKIVVNFYINGIYITLSSTAQVRFYFIKRNKNILKSVLLSTK